MGVSKTEKFTEYQNQIALISKAFAHPARVAILEHLFNTNSCIFGDLVNEIGLAQATISQHLKGLKQLGIIKGTVEGTSVCHCIDNNKWENIKATLNTFLSKTNSSNNICC